MCLAEDYHFNMSIEDDAPEARLPVLRRVTKKNGVMCDMFDRSEKDRARKTRARLLWSVDFESHKKAEVSDDDLPSYIRNYNEDLYTEIVDWMKPIYLARLKTAKRGEQLFHPPEVDQLLTTTLPPEDMVKIRRAYQHYCDQVLMDCSDPESLPLLNDPAILDKRLRDIFKDVQVYFQLCKKLDFL